MKIVMLEADILTTGDISFEPLYALGEVVEYPLTPDDKIVEYIGDAEIALCNKTSFSEEILRACPNLKFICVCATGYNNINLEVCKELGIVVSNAPAYSTEAVAQQVFSFILHFSNKTAAYFELVKDGGWIRSRLFSNFSYPTMELSGKTIGIIGYGAIGRNVAKIAHAFNMNVIVNTRTAKQDSNVKFVGLPELFAKSDIITAHCPLTDATYNIINADVLKLCKPEAILINTSRGAVINESDLAWALNNDVIAGAGLDVLTVEPMSHGSPLIGAKNCVITPHIAWTAYETRYRLFGMVIDNLKAYIDGSPINVVTP